MFAKFAEMHLVPTGLVVMPVDNSSMPHASTLIITVPLQNQHYPMWMKKIAEFFM
jgi:hypothetical protein